ncbi:MAG TPA: CRISPR-associated endoribonuclease Cas6 [Flavobacteriaceae bacterium]|nr:CRISPR-associated endoribonuclease Cas6 [Flavobacteriaceae bacterium]
MRFKIQLHLKDKAQAKIPINYQYPLSAAIYKILAKGDEEYAKFLHAEGYGKGYKFFTFSDLKGSFKIRKDRMTLLKNTISLQVNFHLPEASRTFIEGLFRSEEIVIADKKSKAQFNVQSVISIENPLKDIPPNEIISVMVKPISPIVIGKKRDTGHYTFLAPDDDSFVEQLINSWRSKIAANYNDSIAVDTVLLAEIEKYRNPWRSRLVTIKADTPEETKIRGFLNFKIKLTAESRFIDLILNAGLGLYSAQGMGCLKMISRRIFENNLNEKVDSKQIKED